MAGWHHQLSGDEFEQTPGNSEGQGSPACCSPWGHQESDTTEQLNNKNKLFQYNNISEDVKNDLSDMYLYVFYKFHLFCI